jgi:hypothetical protein
MTGTDTHPGGGADVVSGASHPRSRRRSAGSWVFAPGGRGYPPGHAGLEYERQQQGPVRTGGLDEAGDPFGLIQQSCHCKQCSHSASLLARADRPAASSEVVYEFLAGERRGVVT